MFKGLSKLLKLYFSLYGFQTLLWVLLQSGFILLYRHMAHLSEMGESHSKPAQLAILGVLFLIALNSFVLILFTGNLFSSAQRGAWLRQLPIDLKWLNVIPLLIISIHGLTLLFTLPWGAFHSGVSYFVIGLPLVLFLLLKTSRIILVGLAKASLVSAIISVLWMYLVYDWSVFQPQFLVELVAIALISFIAIWIAGRERRFLIPIALTMLTVLILCLGYRQTRVPSDSNQAVLDHAFWPTEKTWVEYKRIALDPKYWMVASQYEIPVFVGIRAQELSRNFSDDENIRFIQNVESEDALWQEISKGSNRSRINRFSTYIQPLSFLESIFRYPIAEDAITPKVEAFLYENWKESPVYCGLLPARRSVQYLNTIFSNDSCAGIFFKQAPWMLYSLSERGEFEESFDRHLLRAYKKSSPRLRSVLGRFMVRGWVLERDKYDKLGSTVFSQTPLTSDVLTAIRNDRYRLELKSLKKLGSIQRDDFLRAVDTLPNDSMSSEFNSARVPVSFMCQYLFVDCNDFLLRKAFSKRSLLEHWRERANALTFQEMDVWFYWIKQELRKEENWPKIEELLKYVQSRPDL